MRAVFMNERYISEVLVVVGLVPLSRACGEQGLTQLLLLLLLPTGPGGETGGDLSVAGDPCAAARRRRDREIARVWRLWLGQCRHQGAARL